MWDHPGCVDAQPIPLNRFRRRAEPTVVVYFGKPSGRKMRHDSDEWVMLSNDARRKWKSSASESLPLSFSLPFFIRSLLFHGRIGSKACVTTFISFFWERKLCHYNFNRGHARTKMYHVLYIFARGQKNEWIRLFVVYYMISLHIIRLHYSRLHYVAILQI